ncbi:MAG TPA: Rne/Rng family ribonuclease [Arachidicoccus sp.]|nr:Rne/Rng family ribonuclease [Arachidicoccus sp.]
MDKELIVRTSPKGVDLALLENKKLVELQTEQAEAGFAVGDLFFAKVKKLMPGLNAAFVDVGHEKDAFLHYTDLSPYIKSLIKFTQLAQHDKTEHGFDFYKFHVEPEIVKTGKITEVLQGKPSLLVQILKEPIASKGPRLSCEISLPGRFIVITPFNNVVAVSKKVHSADERKRLHKIVESIKPNNIGVIVRTAAEGKNTAELHEDLRNLLDSWKEIQHKLKTAKTPTKILSEENKTTSLLRDLLTKDFNRIVVNEKGLYNDTVKYIQKIAPSKVDIVKLYQEPQNIFDSYGITKQIKSSFGKTINLPSGAYLIIEHTEALHVIDVNSGYKSISNSQEENALATNLEAAEEIARQLRLRDIGGIIVVDFIDMKNPENRKKVQEAMADQMKTDRARHAVLPISKFGVMQLTRQRMRPEIKINTAEVCPTCHGSGKVTSTYLLEDEIENKLGYLITHQHKNITLEVHPIVHSHLTKGIFSSIKKRWKKKFGVPINIISNSNLNFIDVKFFDAEMEEIKM